MCVFVRKREIERENESHLLICCPDGCSGLEGEKNGEMEGELGIASVGADQTWEPKTQLRSPT